MPVLIERRDGVALLTMSRPEARNCWGTDFFEEIAAHFRELEDDDSIGCVVLTGDDKGRAFSAGANLKDPKAHSAKTPDGFIKSLPSQRRNSFPNLIADFAKPVIAAVNGYAVGAGCIMACSCDVAIASAERAEWRLTQASLGILPQHAATARLARWIGKGNAMKLLMGFPVKAEEAQRMGLAQWVVPHASLIDEALEVGRRISALAPLSVRLIKESMNAGMDAGLREIALTDAYRSMALRLTEDNEESHAAWRERRPAKFKGR